MDYDLLGEIRLKTSDDSQESWCLQELDHKGEQVGHDLEPYSGHASFTVSNLSVDYEIEVRNFNIMGREQERELNEYENIRGNLKPRGSPRYSRFRTDRTIQFFTFRIAKLTDDADSHECYVSGYPSFKSGDEFGGDIEGEDCLELLIGLLPASYEKLLLEIKSNRVDELHVQLQFVPGFYSVQWGLGSSENIKVLLYETKPEMHPVILPDNCEIDAPRLGEVKQFKITINQKMELLA